MHKACVARAATRVALLTLTRARRYHPPEQKHRLQIRRNIASPSCNAEKRESASPNLTEV